MRIVLLGLSPSIGMQFYTAGLANAIVSQTEHEALVVGSAALRSNAFDKRVKLLPAYSFSGTGLNLSTLNLIRFYELLRSVDQLCPSVVHLTGPHLWNLPLALHLCRRYPLVFTLHDVTVHMGTKGASLKNAYQRAMVRIVDCVVVHSKTFESVSKHWRVPATAISVMPLVFYNFGYDLYQRIRATGQGVFAYENLAVLFGRLEEYKGIREFLTAARLLGASGEPGIKLIIAGTGSLSRELEQYRDVANLEIRNYVVEDEETVELFSRAGLIVLPYVEASQSAVIPIAYLFQKPVLVTRVGALPEYVRDGVTGRIIDTNDPVTLAKTIENMISDKVALIQMGKAGKNLLLQLEHQFHSQLLDTYTRVTRGET